MPLSLLDRLPPDAPVVDCMECGKLATTSWLVFRDFAGLGLRLVSRWHLRRDGHRRPVCMNCDGGRHVPGPGVHRPEGQAVPIFREMRRVQK